MNNADLKNLEDKAVKLALGNVWDKDAYAVNMAILEIDQNNCAACTRLAKYYKDNDNLAEAKNMYLKALNIDPKNWTAINNLYEINKDQEENETVAKINTTKELAKEAQKSMRKCQYELAAKLYAKAFSMEPTLKNATSLAGAYKKMGKDSEIEELYKQLKDDANVADKKAIESEFKALR